MSKAPQLPALQKEDLDDLRLLASQMAEAYNRQIEFYQRAYKLTRPEAEQKENELHEGYREHLLQTPTNQMSWYTLSELQRESPELSLAAWESIKQEARERIENGHYLLDATEPNPQDRAHFLAIREAFTQQWQPQNAGEQLLVDTMAELFQQQQWWQNILNFRARFELENVRDDSRKRGKLRASSVEIETHAAEMVDRFNKLFLRTMRALRDLRRWSSPVTINNPGQVNIAAAQMNAQQVNPPSGDS